MKRFDPRLYILMRKDMASLNGGKAAAQAAHASSYFTFLGEEAIRNETPFPLDAYNEWKNSTKQAFGTTLVLEVNETQLLELTAEAQAAEYVADIILDPTYPVVDGKTVHLIPINTCSFVFAHSNEHAFYDKLKALKLW